MNVGETIARMKACGMSAEAIVQALECFVSAAPAAVVVVDEQAERRRANDRARKAAKREAECPQNSAESAETPSPLVPPLSPAPLSPPIIPPTHQNSASAKPAKRATRIPDDFEPDESCWHLAESLNFTSQHCQTELDQFRDYWRAVPGAKGLKLDWQATFRTWLRKSAERKPHAQHRPNTIANGFDVIDRAIAAEERRLGAAQDGPGRSQGDTLALPGLRKSAA
jgi:type IV secretory pathway VirB10-like protein